MVRGLVRRHVVSFIPDKSVAVIAIAVVAGAMIAGCGGASGVSAAKPHGISEERAAARAAQGADFLPGSRHAADAKHAVKVGAKQKKDATRR
jgi:hypothetical protein